MDGRSGKVVAAEDGGVGHSRHCGCTYCCTKKQNEYLRDARRGWGQLRESDLRYAAEAGLPHGRSPHNDWSMEEEVPPLWKQWVHGDNDSEGDGSDRPTSRQVGGDHYKSMTIQVTPFIEANGLGWCEGNAIKYICRHHLKGGEADLDKAIHYLEVLKELNYRESEDETD